jgi:NADH-quinone oxidoreductase subunit M
MGWLEKHLLSSLIFLPLVWALMGLCIPVKTETGKAAVKWWSFTGSVAAMIIPFYLFTAYNPKADGFQFQEMAEWIPSLGIAYRLGMDGISLCLVCLTAVITPLAVLGSFSSVREKVREYCFLLLLIETAMFGAFLALDVFLFYVFWEVMLVPMFFIIGIWGGNRRIYAALKFFLYTLVGSLLMLVAIFYLAHLHKQQFGVYSTALSDWCKLVIPGGGMLSVQCLLFLAFALAFSIKVPLFPLHTWLPDAHVQAPTAGSVILAAVLLKMGGYGFIRLAFPLFPQAIVQYQVLFMALGAIAVVYGAGVALAQTDIKKLVAYSSVSHMGYVILGLFSLQAIGASGALFQMISHGLATGALFLIVGMFYERKHTRELSDYGGMAQAMPLMAVSFMVISLASIALPGTSGFVGEFFVLVGAWKTSPALAAFAALGAILGAVYLLGAYQKMMLGRLVTGKDAVRDLSWRERFVLLPTVVGVVFLGVVPSLVTAKFEPALLKALERAAEVRR